MKYSNKKWNDVVCKAHIAYVCQKNSKTGAIYKLKKKENSNTRKLRKISRAPSKNRTHDPPSSAATLMASRIGRDKAKLFDRYGLLYTPVKKETAKQTSLRKGDTSIHLVALFLKKSKRVFASVEFQKIMVQYCYLRLS